MAGVCPSELKYHDASSLSDLFRVMRCEPVGHVAERLRDMVGTDVRERWVRTLTCECANIGNMGGVE